MAGPLAQRFEAQPLASAGGRVITSPFQFITTGEDHLRITSLNSLSGARLKVRGRVIPTSGPLEAFEHDHVPTTDRTARTTTQPLQAGAVLNVDVFVSTGSPQRGQTFVIVQLVRGLGAAGIVLGTLLAGYVTSTQHLAWPGSPITHSFDGPGALRQIVGTNPAAGAELSESVPTGARWRLVSFISTLTTNATIVSRVPLLAIIVAGSTTLLCPPGDMVNSASFMLFEWFTGYPLTPIIAPNVAAASVPTELLLPAGTELRTSTIGLQAGDDWSFPTLFVMEWLEVN